MAFHERWFGAPKQKALAEMTAEVRAQGAAVEVGSWEGRSTIQLARTFDTVHAIDHWLGDLTDPKSRVAELARQRDVFADFQENCEEAGVWDKIVVHRCDWRDVAWAHLEPIAFLFIDGQHTYDEVRDNIAVALPYMRPGAVIAGDDYTVTGVRRAARDAFGKEAITQRASMWSVPIPLKQNAPSEEEA